MLQPIALYADLALPLYTHIGKTYLLGRLLPTKVTPDMLRRIGIPILVLLAAVLLPLFLTTGMADDEHMLHEFEHKQLSTEFFCEGATFGDISGDGILDLISGPYWFEAPQFEVQHTIYEPSPYSIEAYSDCFFNFVEDFNNDGLMDVFRLGFPGKEASWYENPGSSESDYWQQHIVFEGVDNESPTFVDLTGDGKREMLFITNGRYGYAEPDWNAPEKALDICSYLRRSGFAEIHPWSRVW